MSPRQPHCPSKLSPPKGVSSWPVTLCKTTLWSTGAWWILSGKFCTLQYVLWYLNQIIFFHCRPNYLGNKVEFSNMFERPIQNGQCVDSTPKDVRVMRHRAHVLHEQLKGFVQRYCAMKDLYFGHFVTWNIFCQQAQSYGSSRISSTESGIRFVG